MTGELYRTETYLRDAPAHADALQGVVVSTTSGKGLEPVPMTTPSFVGPGGVQVSLSNLHLVVGCTAVAHAPLQQLLPAVRSRAHRRRFCAPRRRL